MNALRIVLRDELRIRRIGRYRDRYLVNGGMDAETRRALLDLALANDRR